MKTMKLKLLGTTAVVALAVSFNASAATFTQDSFIQILDALNVTETQQLNFGVIENPTTTVTVAVTTANTVNAGSTTATHLDASSVASGIYTITGSAGETVEISAVDGANVAGLQFTTITGKFGAGSDTNILSGSITGATLTGGTGTLNVGGVLEVADTLASGTYAPEFDLTVNYE